MTVVVCVLLPALTVTVALTADAELSPVRVTVHLFLFAVSGVTLTPESSGTLHVQSVAVIVLPSTDLRVASSVVLVASCAGSHVPEISILSGVELMTCTVSVEETLGPSFPYVLVAVLPTLSAVITLLAKDIILVSPTTHPHVGSPCDHELGEVRRILPFMLYVELDLDSFKSSVISLKAVSPSAKLRVGVVTSAAGSSA